MRTRNLLLASLLVSMYGCQPETPAQPSVTPAAAPVSAPAPVEPAAPAMMPASAPAPTAEPAPAAKPAPAVQEKPAAVKAEAPAAKPAAPVPTSTAAKAEPAPVAAAVKPEVKPESKPVATMSDADALALAKKSGCLVCHAIDKKVVGPGWRDVAAKYRGDAGAETRLMDKIAKGGSGVWGSIAMPSNSKLGEDERRALAKFVLSLK